MTRLDHEKRARRDRIARNGSDNIADFGLPAGLSPPRTRPSKADLRAELAAAEAKVSRLVVCRCGHRATVKIPSAWVGRRALKCSKCDARVPA